MISPLKVSQKRCLGTSIESFTGSSPSEQIMGWSNLFVTFDSEMYLKVNQKSLLRMNIKLKMSEIFNKPPFSINALIAP